MTKRPRGMAGGNAVFSEKGIALLMVLWVFVLLSIISLHFLSSQRWHSASTRNFKEETQSYYVALSGYQEAVYYLMSDKEPSFDFIDNEGNFWIDLDTQPVTGKRSVGGAEVEIMITDENSRININLANIDQTRRLFEYAGVKSEKVQELIDSIMDWKDPGDEHHLQGAESDYYEDLDEPYPAKNALFDVPEELALVKGITPEMMSGSGEGGGSLLPLITTFGRGMMNINTVSRETMQILGLNEFEMEAIMKQRTPEVGGFRFIPKEFAAYGLRAIASTNFRIVVTARMVNSSLASRIEAVVFRKITPEGYQITTEYWREGATILRG